MKSDRVEDALTSLRLRVFVPSMRIVCRQIVLGLAWLALVPGPSATACAVEETFGLEPRHAGECLCDDTPAEDHDHGRECPETCSLDFGQAHVAHGQTTAPEVEAVDWDGWDEFSGPFAASPPCEQSAVAPPDPPPSDLHPSATGVFLI